jgi:hypothetical protein
VIAIASKKVPLEKGEYLWKRAGVGRQPGGLGLLVGWPGQNETLLVSVLPPFSLPHNIDGDTVTPDVCFPCDVSLRVHSLADSCIRNILVAPSTSNPAPIETPAQIPDRILDIFASHSDECRRASTQLRRFYEADGGDAPRTYSVISVAVLWRRIRVYCSD